MGETLIAVGMFFAISAFIAYIAIDMVNYAPGERRKAMAERQRHRHSRSHYNTRRK